MLAPPLTPAAQVLPQLRAHGFAVLDAASVCQLSGARPQDLAAMAADWDDLPRDAYLLDGGRYRARRHASFTVDGGQMADVAHRAHWQPKDYNALHGGLERWFEPVPASTTGSAAWRALIVWLASLADGLRGAQRWFGEAHEFRIDTTDGIGRPTPEGAHRDGVDLVAVFLVQRHQVLGGETRVFDLATPLGQRFTLQQPWSVLLMDDARVIHESTAIRALHPYPAGLRDTLVVTLRAHGFPSPQA